MHTWTQQLFGLLRQRCPVCLRGPVFTGLFRPLDRCPACSYKFEREPGYFLGALYASHFMAIPILGILTLLLSWWVVPDWALENVVLLAIGPYLLLVPLMFRYSRLIWMYIDAPVQVGPTVEPGETHRTSHGR